MGDGLVGWCWGEVMVKVGVGEMVGCLGKVGFGEAVWQW